VLLLLAALAAWVVRLGLAPLTAMERTAQQISAGDLSRRVDDVDPHTEAGRLGIAFNAMLGQIESALAARTASEQRLRQFLADASHELRTPLTTIRGFAELYRQGAAQQPEQAEKVVRRIEEVAARMGLLVEDLLLLARLDQQRPLARQPVDLLSLAGDAVHDARLLAPARTVDLSVQPGAAFLVIGDEPRLRQVIGNLMSNALTHTPDGTPIEVSIGSGTLDPRLPDSPPAVTLDVTDHGPGMTPEQAHRVFERFYRTDQARTRATGGSGLGLAIVNALVSAHGGVASVRTAPGKGATFRIALPLAPEARGGAAADDDPDLDEAGEAPDPGPGPDPGPAGDVADGTAAPGGGGTVAEAGEAGEAGGGTAAETGGTAAETGGTAAETDEDVVTFGGKPTGGSLSA
jgi:two-component system OmpR family sensor kinase